MQGFPVNKPSGQQWTSKSISMTCATTTLYSDLFSSTVIAFRKHKNDRCNCGVKFFCSRGNGVRNEILHFRPMQTFDFIFLRKVTTTLVMDRKQRVFEYLEPKWLLCDINLLPKFYKILSTTSFQNLQTSNGFETYKLHKEKNVWRIKLSLSFLANFNETCRIVHGINQNIQLSFGIDLNRN